MNSKQMCAAQQGVQPHVTFSFMSLSVAHSDPGPAPLLPGTDVEDV